MTPDDLRADAAQFDAEAREAIAAGDIDRAVTLIDRANVSRAVADRLERLPRAMTRGNDISVTQAQERRRVRAIATTKAEKATELHRAIVQKWGSLTAAAKAMRVSQPLLSQALTGARAVPPHVRERVLAETGRDDWPPRKPR